MQRHFMTRPLEAQLLSFCVEQQARFDPAAWTRPEHLPAELLAATARFLAATEWYGHRAELESIAKKLSDLPLTSLWRQIGFQPSRFSSLLRAQLRHRVPSVVA